MNTRFICASMSLVFSCLFTNFVVAQTLVEDTQIELVDDSPLFFPSTQLTVLTNVEGNESTSIGFSTEASSSPGFATLTFESIFLDQGSDWYLVEAGDVFSEASIADGAHIFWGGVSPSSDEFVFGEIDVPIGEFFLGVNTDGFPSPFLARDIFGWARFSIDADLNIELIDSAVAYNTSQIIVGENVIPEPSTAAGFILLYAAAQLNHRRTRRNG